jgi:hypothetical protein
MKKIQTYITAFILLAVSALVFVPVPKVSAAPLDGVCANNADSAVCANKDDNADGLVKTLVNVLLYILGAISVLVIIVGGFLYVLSGGNSASVAKAKNAITYAIVGLIVAFLAYAIVNWVFNLF